MGTNRLTLSVAFALVACLALVAGCNGKDDQAAGKKTPGGEKHEHPSEGPHGGQLIELGNEEYHAELVHGD